MLIPAPSPPQEFTDSVKSAGALGARKTRLCTEMLRYGMDGFKFVENEYYSWVSWCLPLPLASLQNV